MHKSCSIIWAIDLTMEQSSRIIQSNQRFIKTEINLAYISLRVNINEIRTTNTTIVEYRNDVTQP